MCLLCVNHLVMPLLAVDCVLLLLDGNVPSGKGGLWSSGEGGFAVALRGDRVGEGAAGFPHLHFFGAKGNLA